MNRIFIQGDIHGNPMGLSNKSSPELKDTDRSDVVVFLGDFGIPWGILSPSYKTAQYDEDRYHAKWLNDRPFTSLVLLGNHDDRDAIKQMPIVEKFGGRCRQLSFCGRTYENIFIVEGTQVLEVNGKKCLVISGAKSHDVFVRPLDPYAETFKQDLQTYKKTRKWYRIEHWSWWKDEDIDIELTKQIILDNVDTHFDLVLSHDCPASYAANQGFNPTEGEYLLDGFRKIGDFTDWYHGHMHDDYDYGNIHCRYRLLTEVE